jgi:hypothetical protein
MKIYPPNAHRRVTEAILDINYCYLTASKGTEQRTGHLILEDLTRSLFQRTVVTIHATYLNIQTALPPYAMYLCI